MTGEELPWLLRIEFSPWWFWGLTLSAVAIGATLGWLLGKYDV
jgi:hypothetical protein